MIDGFDFIKVFVGLMAIMDPLGNAPVFLSMTPGYAPAERSRVALVSTLATIVTLTVVALAGDFVLRLFGFSIDDLRVAGGLILLLIGMSMLHAQPSGVRSSSAETEEGAHKQSPAVVPLAIPMIAGPGAMATVMVFAQGPSLTTKGWVVAAIVGNAVLTYIVFRAAIPLQRVMGVSGMNIVVRIMGLILAAIAIEMIAAGLRGIFPILGQHP